MPQFDQALFQLIQEERLWLEQWMEWPQQVKTLAKCQRYLREMQLMNQAGLQFFTFIMDHANLVGSIALTKIDRKNLSGELGFWKSKNKLDKTKMLMATQSFIGVIWEKSQMNRLEIKTAADNLPARRLSEKLGFQLEGIKRDALLINEQLVDLHVYGLLRKDNKT